MAKLVQNGNLKSGSNLMRRHCKFCTITCRDPTKEGNKVVHVSVFAGEKPRLTASFCSICLEALCDTPPTSGAGRYASLSCHDRFHIQRCLPANAAMVPANAAMVPACYTRSREYGLIVTVRTLFDYIV